MASMLTGSGSGRSANRYSQDSARSHARSWRFLARRSEARPSRVCAQAMSKADRRGTRTLAVFGSRRAGEVIAENDGREDRSVCAVGSQSFQIAIEPLRRDRRVRSIADAHQLDDVAPTRAEETLLAIHWLLPALPVSRRKHCHWRPGRRSWFPAPRQARLSHYPNVAASHSLRRVRRLADFPFGIAASHLVRGTLEDSEYFAHAYFGWRL